MNSILGIDWRKAWREQLKTLNKSDDSASWDARAQSYKENSGRSSYAETFLTYLDLQPGQSVLDMGSGSGTLAIPLAKAGHPVISADFSSGMRQAAAERVKEEGLTNIDIKALDWNEDWEKAGIAPKSVDVAIASRSTMVDDLEDAFIKLDRTARSKVALTMVTEYGPKGHKPMGSRQGACEDYIPDFIFGVNLLLQMGAFPELRYIDCIRDFRDEMNEKLVRWAYISWEPITFA